MKVDTKSLVFKNRMYYILFSVFILALLWVLQVFFMEAFYENMKTAEIIKIGNRLRDSYVKNGNFVADMSDFAYDNTIFIMLLDDNQAIISSSEDYFRMTEGRIRRIFTDEMNKIKTMLSETSQPSIHFTQEINGRKILTYAAKINAPDGSLKYLYVNSNLLPIDPTTAVLVGQLKIITVILLLLSITLSQIMSRKISAPIARLTKSANELAGGKLEVVFDQDDFTEIKQLSEALTYATKELSKTDGYRKDIMANVSHDLKTPLTIIKFYGEMIRDVSGDNPEKRTAHSQLIVNEADRLTALVNEILELSKLQSNTFTLNMTEFNLSSCLYVILDNFKELHENEGYKIHSEIEDDIFVFADEPCIKRVIYNLVSNAVNYTGDDKSVSVSLFSSGGKARFSVTDTGEGIEPDQLQTIWERYFMAHKTRKKNVVGTGLGLAIVKNMLELHKSGYGVISKVGEGSTFWFEL